MLFSRRGLAITSLVPPHIWTVQTTKDFARQKHPF